MKKKLKNKGNTPFECTALLLQGGGALGSYQAGVYEALSKAGLEPNWIAGISIGAINAALIAGNPPEHRIARLREFWELVTADPFKFTPNIFKSLLTSNHYEHKTLNRLSAMRSMLIGIPGFFTPHLLPWLEPIGTKGAISFCDISPLKTTLEKLIDFDRINEGDIYFKIGATHVQSGDFTDFNNEDTKIGVNHIMASGALPPGFPPVEVEGDYYWDGGLVSNTPLQWVFDNKTYADTLIFQVDLWSADGDFPQNMAQVMTRSKDIQYSSRTRANTERFKETHALQHAIAQMVKCLPEKLSDTPEMKILKENANDKFYNIVHLIYHNKSYEGYSKDFEFSSMSMESHWQAGYDDTIRTLKHPEVLQRPHTKEGIAIFDFRQEKKIKRKVG